MTDENSVQARSITNCCQNATLAFALSRGVQLRNRPKCGHVHTLRTPITPVTRFADQGVENSAGRQRTHAC
jgi:hypothetical protein